MSKTIRQKFRDVLSEVGETTSDSYLAPYADHCWGIYMRNSSAKADKEAIKALKRIQDGELLTDVISEYEESLETYQSIIKDVEG